MASYTAEEILAYFDRCDEDYVFPALDNDVFALGAVRLSAYRDDERWAVLIEVLCFFVNSSGPPTIGTDIYRFGNCLPGAPGINDDGVGGLTCLDDEGQDVPLDAEPFEATIAVIRGRKVPIPRDTAAYVAKGMKPSKTDWEPDGPRLMWVLLPEYRLDMLATEEELRQHVPADLPLFLRLDEWHHPDVCGKEVPSTSETFRKLAEALVHGEPNRFRLRRKPNTHWKKWAWKGSL
jgi:hypothetical protein